MIQSQSALACASCARSLGSGNRCPGVLWSGVLVLLLPSFSSLSSMARKLINFQSCTILLVAFLGKCQVFGLKISFKKAIGSSSYSSITISSRVLLSIKRPWKGAYLFSPQFPRRRRRIMVSLEYLPYWVSRKGRLFVYGRPSGSASSAFCFPYNSVTVRRILFKFGRFMQ